MQSPDNKVAVCRCHSYNPPEVHAAIRRLFDCLGGPERFIRPGQRVLIKPNLIVPKPPDSPAQTHPEVIYAVASLVKDAGAHALVGDSPAWSNTEGCLKALGIHDRLRELGVEIVQLSNPVRTRIEGNTVGLSKVALDADAIINLPKLKAHQQLVATFALKNMYGCVCGLGGKEKAYWHFARGREPDDFCRLVVGVYRQLAPVLTIVDAVVAMEGQGPINGTPRPLGYLISATDPVACERVCCDLVGFDPASLPLLRAAEEMRFGLAPGHPVTLVGDPFTARVCPDFKPASQTPLRFSLPRILKSVTKQLLILMKTAFSRRKH